MAQASSVVYTVTAPKLNGIWVHDPEAAEVTVANFPFGNVGRGEEVSVTSAELRFIGRTLPVFDMGGFESNTLNIEVLVPAGPDEEDMVDWFRTMVRNRRTLCYRDNRGRMSYGIIGGISISDQREGSSVSFDFITVDYNEEI